MSGGAARNRNSLANLRRGNTGLRVKWIDQDQLPRLVRLFLEEHLTYRQLAERFDVTLGQMTGMLWRSGARKRFGRVIS